MERPGALAMTSADAQPLPTDPRVDEPAGGGAQPSRTPHNFEVQKEEHRRIRNDPDYDDWEYGTEPLPQEAWRPSPSQDGGGELSRDTAA